MYIQVPLNGVVRTNYYLSLYSDTGGGYPADRLWAPDQQATTVDGPSGDGNQELGLLCPAPEVPLAAGYYWIVGIWDAGLSFDVAPISPRPKWVEAVPLLPDGGIGLAFQRPPEPFPTVSLDTSTLPQLALDFYAVVLE